MVVKLSEHGEVVSGSFCGFLSVGIALGGARECTKSGR